MTKLNIGNQPPKAVLVRLRKELTRDEQVEHVRAALEKQGIRVKPSPEKVADKNHD